MDELIPCPFCGETHQWETLNDLQWGRNESIVCHYKVLLSAFNEREKEIITELWNTRPIEDALRAENAALREALGRIAAFNFDVNMQPAAYAMRDIAERATTNVTRWMPLPPEPPQEAEGN